MYLDLCENENLEAGAMATFKETGAARVVGAVRLQRAGTWQWCAATGWDKGPVTAYVTPIEESGDGPALLLHGGAQGVRLAPLASESSAQALAQARLVAWDVQSVDQWGEPFLLCLHDTVFAYAAASER